jgi:uncharacterized phage protein (TIGR02218 family)
VSNPIDLYRVATATKVWTFTGVDTGKISDGITYNSGSGDEYYVPLPVSRGNIEQKNEVAKQDLTITIPIDSALAQFLLVTYVSEVLSLTMFTKRGGSYETSWKGRLVSYKPEANKMQIIFESVFSGLRRVGLRAVYQAVCRHALYGRGCNLAIESFATTSSMTARADNVVTVTAASAQPDGYYTGGLIRDPAQGLSYIINHVGATLTLQRVSKSLLGALPMTVKIYPGCNHTRLTCKDKFNNLPNYGGFDWLPQKNPTGGSSII